MCVLMILARSEGLDLATSSAVVPMESKRARKAPFVGARTVPMKPDAHRNNTGSI